MKTKQKGKCYSSYSGDWRLEGERPRHLAIVNLTPDTKVLTTTQNLPVWCAGKGRRAELLPWWPRRCACGEGNEGNGASCPSAGSPAPVATDPDVREQIGGGDARSRQMEGKMILRPLQPTDRYLPNYFQLF